MQSKSRAKRSAANTAWQREATYSMLHSSETQLNYGETSKTTTTETQFKTTRSKSKRCKAKQTSATRTNATQNPEHQRKSEHIRSGITGANYVYSSALGRACAMEDAGRNPPTAYLQRWTASEQLIATSQPTAVTFHNVICCC